VGLRRRDLGHVRGRQATKWASVDPEHDAFVQRYLAACRRNPLLKGQPLMTEPDLVAALKILEKEAEAIANRTALQVFMGTAISQHGALDGVIVAAAQARMVWRIAHVYQRRPSLRHLGYLYSNVIATTMAAAQLARIDLSEYVRPMVSAVVG